MFKVLVLRHDPEEFDTRADLAIDLQVVADNEQSKTQSAPTEIDPGVAVEHEAKVDHEERCNWQYVPAEDLQPPVVDAAAVLVDLEVEAAQEMVFHNRIRQQNEPEAAAERGVEVEHEVAVVHELPDPNSKQWISMEREIADIPHKFFREQH